jgi:hypothetical protein
MIPIFINVFIIIIIKFESAIDNYNNNNSSFELKYNLLQIIVH